KAGVNATCDGLGVLADETDRLDERISALAEQLERHDSPAAPAVDLTPVYNTVAELLDRHAATAAPEAPAVDLIPVYQAIAELREAIEERDVRSSRDDTETNVGSEVVAAVESIRAEIAELRAAVADRTDVAGFTPAVEPDLSPVHEVV